MLAVRKEPAHIQVVRNLLEVRIQLEGRILLERRILLEGTRLRPVRKQAARMVLQQGPKQRQQRQCTEQGRKPPWLFVCRCDWKGVRCVDCSTHPSRARSVSFFPLIYTPVRTWIWSDLCHCSRVASLHSTFVQNFDESNIIGGDGTATECTATE